MLYFKDGVQIDGIKPEMVLGATLVAQVYAKYDKDCIVTSCTDGKHKEGSFHYGGLALDFRTKHLNSELNLQIYDELTRQLHKLGFDVIWESKNQENEHFHIEFDPKYN